MSCGSGGSDASSSDLLTNSATETNFVAIDPIERLNLTFSAGAVAASLALATPSFAGGVAAGAALEAVNFRGLRRSSELLFSGEVDGRRGWSAGFGLRFGLLAAGIVGAIWAGAHPVGLLLGLSLIIPAVVIHAWRNRPPVDPDAPVLAEEDAWERWNPWLAREVEDDGDDDSAEEAP